MAKPIHKSPEHKELRRQIKERMKQMPIQELQILLGFIRRPVGRPISSGLAEDKELTKAARKGAGDVGVVSDPDAPKSEYANPILNEPTSK